MIRVVDTNNQKKVLGYIERSLYNASKYLFLDQPKFDYGDSRLELNTFKDDIYNKEDREYILGLFGREIMNGPNGLSETQDLTLEFIDVIFEATTSVSMLNRHKVRVVYQRVSPTSEYPDGFKTILAQ